MIFGSGSSGGQEGNGRSDQVDEETSRSRKDGQRDAWSRVNAQDDSPVYACVNI